MISGCKSNKNNQLMQPFEAVTIPYESFLVDPVFGGHIYLRDGSQIIIPPYAFVDEEGNRAERTITLSIRRFATAGAVIVSGLPVPGGNDEARQLLSAAFELKATMDTSKVEIAPRQEIQVLIGCECTATAYDICHYTGPAESWEPQDATFLKINTIKRQLSAQPVEVPPPPVVLPVASSEDSILHLDYPLYRIDHLRIYPRIVWKYIEGSLPETMERGSFFLMQDTLNFMFHFQAVVEEDTFRAKLVPRIAPEDSADAAYRYARAMKQWQSAHEAVTSEELNLQRLADNLYQVPVKKLGYYGLTGRNPGRNFKTHSLSFTLNGEEINPKLMYVLNKQNQLLLRLPERKIFTFQLPANQQVHVLLIFPEDRATVVPWNKITAGGTIEIGELVKIEQVGQLDSLLGVTDLEGPI